MAVTCAQRLVSVAEAQALVDGSSREAEMETRWLDDAGGSVLREEIRADRDFPPFDRVAMDGIALRSCDTVAGIRRFRIVGTQPAGSLPLSVERSGECLEAMTGAVLPTGCDCVVPVEEIERDGEFARLCDGTSAHPGRNVHLRASDYTRGELLLPPGVRLDAAEIAICAAVGKEAVSVSAQPRIALIATGDELVESGNQPLSCQIRISNTYALKTMLASFGFTRCERLHVRDIRSEVDRVLRAALSHYDILVVSGGVSAGKLDYVPAALEALGVLPLFYRVRQRPGLPVWFGTDRSGKAVFGLPGNPVANVISARRYLIPYLERCAALADTGDEHAVLAEEISYERNLTLFLPVALEQGGHGELLAHPRPVHGSGDFARLVESDGFIELPAGRKTFGAGSTWPLFRWARH